MKGSNTGPNKGPNKRPKKGQSKALKQTKSQKIKANAQERAKRIWDTRLGRWSVIGASCLLGFFAIAAWLITYTDTYKNIPAKVWESGDLNTLSVMAKLLSPEQRRQLDSLRAANSQSATNPSPIVAKAAAAWVKAINENSHGAILQGEADSFGNLYLVLGSWWDEAGDNHRIFALDGMGATWRAYLSQQFPTIGSSNFKPGIFIVDERGKVAQNVSGKVELLRR